MFLEKYEVDVSIRARDWEVNVCLIAIIVVSFTKPGWLRCFEWNRQLILTEEKLENPEIQKIIKLSIQVK